MKEMERRRAVVLIVDRLGSGYLGPYGNTWIDSPAINELARCGILAEQTLVDALELSDVYQSLWYGTHAARPATSSTTRSLLQRLAERSLRSRLVTDEQELTAWRGADAFQSAQLLPVTEAEELAEEPEETNLARLMAAAAEVWESDDWDLLWIHSRGMNGPWDAPEGFRLQFCDEEDPPPPLDPLPPHGPLPAETDPDWLQGWIWSYAAQVSLFDWCLRPLFDRWRESTIPTLWILMGARGMALGEHGHLGDSAERPHSELVQVPLLIASNQWQDTQARCQTMVQPPHVHATLVDWFSLPPETVEHDPFASAMAAGQGSLLPWWQLDSESAASDQPLSWPPLAVTRFGAYWALRTPAWHVCLPDQEATELTHLPAGCQLYLKPDDRWDFNDVADRCEAIVMEFQQLLKRWKAGEPITADVLDAQLLAGVS